MHTIRINPLVLEDLQEIKKYITEELENPAAALNVVSSIIESYEKLKEFPMLGGELAAKINIPTDFRYLISGSYLVFYKVDSSHVSIYRVLYAKRDYLTILFNNEKLE